MNKWTQYMVHSACKSLLNYVVIHNFYVYLYVNAQPMHVHTRSVVQANFSSYNQLMPYRKINWAKF